MIAVWAGIPFCLKLQTRMNCVSQSQKIFTYSFPDEDFRLCYQTPPFDKIEYGETGMAILKAMDAKGLVGLAMVAVMTCMFWGDAVRLGPGNHRGRRSNSAYTYDQARL